MPNFGVDEDGALPGTTWAERVAAREERARIVAAIRKLRQQRLLGQKPDKPWNGQDWADWIEKGCPDE